MENVDNVFELFPQTAAQKSDDGLGIGLALVKGLIELKVNGKVRQTSDLSKLIWSLPEVIAFLSKLVKLEAGDLIFSGTPEGVAACVRGDVLEGTVAGVGTVKTKIV